MLRVTELESLELLITCRHSGKLGIYERLRYRYKPYQFQASIEYNWHAKFGKFRQFFVSYDQTANEDFRWLIASGFAAFRGPTLTSVLETYLLAADGHSAPQGSPPDSFSLAA